MSSKQVVLITGGYTGLGYATAQALLGSGSSRDIIITSRTLKDAEKAAAELGKGVVGLQLDLGDDKSIEELSRVIREKYGRLDVLINNAGIQFDPKVASGEMTVREAYNAAFNINVSGTHVLTDTLLDLLIASPDRRILFVSSGIGSLADHSDPHIPVNGSPPAGWPKEPTFNVTTYRTTKTAMNMMVLEFCRILRKDDFKIHIIDPGLLATGLGGLGKERLKAIGAEEPIVGGEFVRKVVEGDHDAECEKMLSRQGVVAW